MPLSSTNYLRYHWLIDSSLVPNVLGRHKVSWPREATLLAAKIVSSGSIRLCDERTLRASPTRIARINLNDGYTQPLCLIFNKAFQLVKPPICHSSSLRLPGLNSFSNAAQVFERNRVGQALSRSYDGFTYAMVSIFLETGLCTRNFLKLALGRTRTLFLQIFSSVRELLSSNFNRSAAVVSALRVHGNINNAKIYTKGTLSLDGRTFGNFTRTSNIKLLPYVHKVNFALTAFKELVLALATGVGNLFSSVQGRQGNSSIRHNSKKFIVKRLCRMLAKSSQFSSIKLVGISNLSNTAYCHLSVQPVFLFDCVVNKFMEVKLSKSFTVPGLLGNIIACGITSRERFLEECMLLIRTFKFNISCQFHVNKYRTTLLTITSSWSRFFPARKDGVSTRGALG